MRRRDGEDAHRCRVHDGRVTDRQTRLVARRAPHLPGPGRLSYLTSSDIPPCWQSALCALPSPVLRPSSLVLRACAARLCHLPSCNFAVLSSSVSHPHSARPSSCTPPAQLCLSLVDFCRLSSCHPAACRCAVAPSCRVPSCRVPRATYRRAVVPSCCRAVVPSCRRAACRRTIVPRAVVPRAACPRAACCVPRTVVSCAAPRAARRRAVVPSRVPPPAAIPHPALAAACTLHFCTLRSPSCALRSICRPPSCRRAARRSHSPLAHKSRVASTRACTLRSAQLLPVPPLLCRLAASWSISLPRCHSVAAPLPSFCLAVTPNVPPDRIDMHARLVVTPSSHNPLVRAARTPSHRHTCRLFLYHSLRNWH